jgi:hypothetical protein
MEIEPKFVPSCPIIEKLLEPTFMSYDHVNSIFALVKWNLMQLRFLFRNLTRFCHERLVLVLK